MSVASPDHIGANVTDLARSIEFYCEALELDLISQSSEGDRRYALLGSGGELPVTLWQQSTGGFATDRPGLHQLAALVADVDSVRQAEADLGPLGRPSCTTASSRTARASPLAESSSTTPDGTRLEIYATSGVDGARAHIRCADVRILLSVHALGSTATWPGIGSVAAFAAMGIVHDSRQGPFQPRASALLRRRGAPRHPHAIMPDCP